MLCLGKVRDEKLAPFMGICEFLKTLDGGKYTTVHQRIYENLRLIAAASGEWPTAEVSVERRHCVAAGDVRWRATVACQERVTYDGVHVVVALQQCEMKHGFVRQPISDSMRQFRAVVA